MKNRISIIIPTYQEEKNISSVLNDLEKKGFGKSETIIIDGSPDNLTQKELEKYPHIIYRKLENSFRANSMNMGAELSTGEILFFLHVDSILPEKSFEALQTIDTSKYDYGCFYKQFSPNSIILKIISGINNSNTIFFKTMLGDNGIFVTKKKFDEIGGFPNIKLMEDVEISKKLKKNGNAKIIKKNLITSSRKFQKRGTIKTFIFMQYIKYLHFIGTDTKILEKKYRSF